jgi:hypothetical protein
MVDTATPSPRPLNDLPVAGCPKPSSPIFSSISSPVLRGRGACSAIHERFAESIVVVVYQLEGKAIPATDTSS